MPAPRCLRGHAKVIEAQYGSYVRWRCPICREEANKRGRQKKKQALADLRASANRGKRYDREGKFIGEAER